MKAKYNIYTKNIYNYALPLLAAPLLLTKPRVRMRVILLCLKKRLPRTPPEKPSHAFGLIPPDAAFANREDHALQQDEEAQHQSNRDALPIWLPQP